MLADLFRDLAPFQPALVGTYPLGLQDERSDLDIACFSRDLSTFEEALERTLSAYAIRPARTTRIALVPEASVTTVAWAGLTLEVFCQPIPVHEQHGFRHMIVEGRLLALGGLELRRRVRDLKRHGLKTEPAFARALGLAVADPYGALLELEPKSHEDLAVLVREGLSRS